MNGRLYQGMWLPLSWDLKNYIATKYNIVRTGMSHVVTQNGQSKISADGYTDSDLSKIDVAFLQIVLNSEDRDFFSLWSKFLNRMENEIKPKPIVEKLEEKPNQVSVNITVNQEGEVIAEKTKVERKVKDNKKTSNAEITEKSEPTA